MEELIKHASLITSINYVNFFIALLLLIVYSWIMQKIYSNYALVVSNKQLFASSFILFALSIFLIITTIKTSLTLSLGLVGALSIIRFRTAIKEPEQIIYLLGLTGISISLAAEQFIVSTVCMILFMVFVIVKKKYGVNINYLNNKYLMVYYTYANDFNNQNMINQIMNLPGIESLTNIEDKDNNLQLLFTLNPNEESIYSEVKEILSIKTLESVNIKITSS